MWSGQELNLILCLEKLVINRLIYEWLMDLRGHGGDPSLTYCHSIYLEGLKRTVISHNQDGRLIG
jgi:hypothetical protein